MSHRDKSSNTALRLRHLACIVLGPALLASYWGCDGEDGTQLNSGGTGGVGAAGSLASGGAAGLGGSGGSVASLGGSSGAGGSGTTAGSAGMSGTPDPDAGVDSSVPDAGGGISFDCTGADGGVDSACALCQVWTQLVDCQPTATCPDEQRNALAGLGCDAQYAAFLDCFASEPVTSSTCAPTPSTRTADSRLGGTGTEHNCQAQECALYDCLGALSPPGCP
jgi:hypothetical protein